jgi:hypothetical protein
MGAEQSTPTSSQESVVVASTSIAQTQRVNVRDFVINNINEAFYALQEEGFKNSNCYALLYTLTHGIITSDTIRDINLSILGVVFEGTTEFSVFFPQIYYRMFLSVSKETDVSITSLLQKKQEWVRNPSQVVNNILGFSGARDKIGQSTNTQNNAISRACEGINQSAKSAGGGCSMSAIFKGASPEQQNRCCICGLGEPPLLTDIEHVVSSQLLILLGLCPGTKSWNGFWQVFNELNSSGGGGANWVEEVIGFFPEEQRKNAGKVFRSMMLPAHETCNRSIKSEWSPFGIDLQNGTITGNINQRFADMNNQTYVEKVIEPSITDANNKRRPKLKNGVLNDHKTDWIEYQKDVFKQIAWFLNSIDQRNNEASWFLITNLYEIANKGKTSDKEAFVQFVADILGPAEVRTIAWENITEILKYPPNQLIIMTKLTLVVEAVLVLFQSDVQTPVQELKYEANSQGDSSSDYSPGSATTGSASEWGSPPDKSNTEINNEVANEIATLSPPGSFPYVIGNDNTTSIDSSQPNQPTTTPHAAFPANAEGSWIHDTNLLSDNPPSAVYSGLVPMQDAVGVNASKRNANAMTSVSDFDDEFRNKDSTITSDTSAKYQRNTSTDTSDKKMGQNDERYERIEERTLNKSMESTRDYVTDALNDYFSRNNIAMKHRDSLAMMAFNNVRDALRDALRDVPDRTDLNLIAREAAIRYVIYRTNDSLSPGLGGGSRKRTTRRRSTRKRRPSKKPRRTIRRQRRNKKRTQKRRK